MDSKNIDVNITLNRKGSITNFSSSPMTSGIGNNSLGGISDGSGRKQPMTDMEVSNKIGKISQFSTLEIMTNTLFNVPKLASQFVRTLAWLIPTVLTSMSIGGILKSILGGNDGGVDDFNDMFSEGEFDDFYSKFPTTSIGIGEEGGMGGDTGETAPPPPPPSTPDTAMPDINFSPITDGLDDAKDFLNQDHTANIRITTSSEGTSEATEKIGSMTGTITKLYTDFDDALEKSIGLEGRQIDSLIQGPYQRLERTMDRVIQKMSQLHSSGGVSSPRASSSSGGGYPRPIDNPTPSQAIDNHFRVQRLQIAGRFDAAQEFQHIIKNFSPQNPSG